MAKKYSSANKDSIKQKKPAGSEVQTPQKHDEPDAQQAAETSFFWGSSGILKFILILFASIFILSLANSMDNILEKWSGYAASIILLIILILSKKNSALKTHITPLFFSVTAYVIWGGISTFYAASGKFAIFEFSKLLVALCVYILVLFFTRPDPSGFKTISYLVASAGCFFGIISVDAASFGFLSNIYKLFLGLFTRNFGSSIMYEQGIRIHGIFGNANTYAGFMAIAVILSIYLARNATNRRSAMISTTLLAFNSLSYLLAFSMGSLFMFLAACLIMIASSEKGSRISLFILMIETAVLTFILAFISMAGLGKSGPVSFLPDLALILNAVLLYLLDRRLRPALNKKLSENVKLMIGSVLIIVVFIALYLFAAFSLSANLPLTAGTNVMRAIYVPGGDYTLHIESTSPVGVNIESQNRYDLMRHTSTALYSGAGDQPIAFKVPDDSKIVRVTFSASDDNTKITGAHYEGVKSGEIHLKYPLLPAFIANRTQNLLANENVVQRVIFFEDGMKLFHKSPIIGRGLGGFENGIYSVQSFYYETKYAHNHYIQTLGDLGIVGLALFLSILVFSVISMVKARRKSRSIYAVPVLAASAVQIFGQAAVDAVWSTGVFLAFAAALLALITVFCSEPIKLKEAFNKDRLQIAEKAGLIIFTGLFVLLLSGNLYAQAHAKAGVKSFDDIKRLIAIDRFEYNDYKLSYVVNAPNANDEKVIAQADVYANDLMKVESNSLAPYIVAYEFQKYADTDAFNVAKQGLANNQSNPNMWIQMFNTFEDYIDPVGPNTDDAADRLRKPKYYVESVIDIYNSLVERNKKSLDDIHLTPSNDAFIGKLLEIKATNQYSIDWTFTTIMTNAFDSECAVDADHNGLPDNLTVLSGSAQRVKSGTAIKISENTVMKLDLYHKLHGTYTLDIKTEAPQKDISVMLNGINQTVQYDGYHAYVKADLKDNTEQSLDTFLVAFPDAAEVNSITFTTKLE